MPDFRTAPAELSIANRCGGRMPVPVARLQTDGGTSFSLRSERREWHRDLDRVVGWLLDMTPEERRLQGGTSTVTLPLPPVPSPDAGAVDEVSPDASLFRAPYPTKLGWELAARQNPDAPHVAFTAWASPGSGSCVYLHAADMAFVKLQRRADSEGVVRWECTVQAKAPELYASGLNRWLVRWLGWMGWLLCGEWHTPRDLAAQGWRTSQWHLNSDILNLRMVSGDAFQMLGWRRMDEHTEGDAHQRRRASVTSSEWTRRNAEFANSIYLGRMTSDCCLVIYQKSEQLRTSERIEPSASIYAPTWARNGWDGGKSEGSDVTRVELRLRKKALVYRDPKTREIVHDLRDPYALLSLETRRDVWSAALWKRRLTCADDTTDRPTRQWVDPAWLRVLNLGVDRPLPDLRQQPRGVRRMTREVRVARAESKAVAVATAWAAQHGAEVRDIAEAGRVLQELGRRLEEAAAITHAHTMPAPLDVQRIAEYAAQMATFFQEDADSHFENLQCGVCQPLRRIDWSRVKTLPQHEDLRTRTQQDDKPRDATPDARPAIFHSDRGTTPRHEAAPERFEAPGGDSDIAR